MFNVQMKNCLNSWLTVKKKKKEKRKPYVYHSSILKQLAQANSFVHTTLNGRSLQYILLNYIAISIVVTSSKNNFPSYFSPDHEQQTTNFNPTNNSRISSYFYLTLPIQNQYDSNFTSRCQNSMLPIKLTS